jgi:glycosyltransferase involved in cell wall biosynthesis
MRILLLTTLVPAGPPSGGTLATIELSRRLEAYGEVERWAVWAYERDAPQDRMWRGARAISLARLRRHGLSRALVRRQPLSVTRFFRPEFARELAACGPVDLLFADHLGVWQYARLVSAKRRVIYSHNVESEIYQRAALLERSALKRAVWSYEARAMARYELRALREPDAVICPGTRDQASLLDRYGVAAQAWYPPVADLRPVGARRGTGKVVGSVGSFTWQPNRWGMDWFVEHAWPAIRASAPGVRLRLAGRGSERLPYAEAPGIECLGPLPDLSSFYESLDVFVAPIRGGAGIKVKVMDAAGRGLPVVTTPIGVEGFGAVLPSTIAVVKADAEFAPSVLTALNLHPELPLREGVLWYQDLIARGAAAVERAIAGANDPGAPVD